MGETERLTLREAADLMGMPLDALRKRVYRGTIPATKIDGQYYVDAIDAIKLAAPTVNESDPRTVGETPGETVLGHGIGQGETHDLAGDYIESLKDEIGYLRQELSEAIRQAAAERERADVLHREALNRIEALTARTEQSRAENPPVTEPHVSDPTPPGREQALQGADTPEHQESWLSSLLRKVLGRS